MHRSVKAEYRFKFKPYDVALRECFESFAPRPLKELVPVTEALGRRLAVDVRAPFDMPRKNLAFYDGYAVRHEDTRGAAPSRPVRLRYAGTIMKEGEEAGLILDRGEAVYVSAGSPLPEGADSLVREEFAAREGDAVMVKKEVGELEDVVLRGEDAREGDVLMRRGSIIRPQDQALLLEIGITRIYVYREPTVAVASVGDELLERHRGGVHYPDNYSLMLASTMRLAGIRHVHLGILGDDPDSITETVSQAVRHYDAVALVGGASRGLGDHAGAALGSVGEIIFHGTTLSPGRVSGVCRLEDRPVFLVPGHVGSAISCLCNVVLPLVSKIHYDGIELLPKVYARLASPLEVKVGSYTFRTVDLKWQSGVLTAKPHAKRLGGSALLTTLSGAGGYVLIPPGKKISEGDLIDVTLFSPLEALRWNHD